MSDLVLSELVCPACREVDGAGVLHVGAIAADGACGRCRRMHRVVHHGGARIGMALRSDDGDAAAMTARALAWAFAAAGLAGEGDADGDDEAGDAPWRALAAVYAGVDHPPAAAGDGPRADADATLRALIAALPALPADGLTLVLGAGAGGAVAALPEALAPVHALDASPFGLAIAVALGQGGRAVPVPGEPGRLAVRAVSVDHITRRRLAAAHWWVADALDPPFAAESARLLVAVNLLDSVADPWLLMGQIDALLAPGGVAIVATPWCFDPGITPVAALPWRHDDSRPLSERAIDFLQHGGGAWELTLLQARLGEPWQVRTSTRAATTYSVDWFVLSKPAPA